MDAQIESLNLQTEQLRDGLSDLGKLADGFGHSMVTAFAGAIIHGRKLSDVLRGLAQTLIQSALTAGLRPLGNLVGGLFSNLLGNATPFAAGGIVNSPTLFPLQGGAGLMGEAGPEAVMPLARGSDGRLGIRGGASVNVTMNISTPDVQGFQRSQSQVAAMMARAVARGQRNF